MARNLFASITLISITLLMGLDLRVLEAARTVPDIIPKSWGVSRQYIIGGTEASRNEYPWMVHILTRRAWWWGRTWRHRCGGSLLGPKFIITAKHCVRGFRSSNVRVVFADHDQTQADPGEYTRPVERIHIHPTSNVDLAILELRSPAILSSRVKVIPYIAAEPAVGLDLTVIGWGWTASSSPGSLANRLQEITIPVAADSKCNAEFPPYPNVLPTEFCAGRDTATYTNVCHGDSGGPAMFELRNPQPDKYLLVGVVARGTPDCPSNANYAAFQSFKGHGNWIYDVTGVKGKCFPGDAMVTVSSGEKKRMDEVIPGDSVLALTPEGSLVYSEVIMMMHADHYSLTEYLTIQTEKDLVALRISDKHMMYVQKQGEEQSGFWFAESVQAGDHVFVADQNKLEGHTLTKLAVANVTRSFYTGAFAPLTLEGTVVVDGIVASSYGYVESQSMCHLALWPVRLVHTWASHLLRGDKAWASGQVHWAPALLQSAASPFIH